MLKAEITKLVLILLLAIPLNAVEEGSYPNIRNVMRNNEPISIDIRFHADVSFERALNLLRSLGIGCSRKQYLAANRFVVKAPWSSIQHLLGAAEVANIDPAIEKVSLTNLGASKRMFVNEVLRNPKFHKPDGDGILVGVTDSWVVDKDHIEFDNRVAVLHDKNAIEPPDSGAGFGHATFVAGGIAASGVNNPLIRGVAPSARILSLLIPFDLINEIEYAAKNLGLKISCNSWGFDADDKFYPPVRILSSQSTDPDGLSLNWSYFHNFNYAMDKMVCQTDVLYVWAVDEI